MLLSIFSVVLVLSFLSKTSSEEEEFFGRKILIIGASSGMGKEAADKVYYRGGKVVYASRSLDKLNNNIKDKDKKRAFALKCNAGKEDDIKKTVEEANKLMDGLDGIVWIPTDTNISHYMTLSQGIEKGVVYESLEGQFFWNVLLFAKFFEFSLPYLKQASSASVVGISSTAVELVGGAFAYSIGKAAQEQACSEMAFNYASQKIRVNCFRAGLYNTDVFSSMGMNDDAKESFLEDARWRIPLGREGTASEAGEMISFLLSDRSSYMSGEALRADGMATRAALLSDVFSPDKKISRFQSTEECEVGGA